MTKYKIFLEGGGDGNAQHILCRKGFTKLLETSGFKGRLPRLVLSGSRNEAFDDFKTEATQKNHDFAWLLVDSEDPVENFERTWEHLKKRDGWEQPAGATDEQVFLMTTCMETWIVADRAALKSHYKQIQESALPPVTGLENRERHSVQDALVHATRDCRNSYKKGTRSFEVVGLLAPTTLTNHLPSFARMMRILNEHLGPG